MSDDQSLNAALWVMIIVQTIGAVDMPGKGARKMPAPRAYVIILVAMGILQLIADAGYLRAAKAMAWVTVAVAAVLGPFGPRFVGFLNTVATNFSNSPAPLSGTNTPNTSSFSNTPFF